MVNSRARPAKLPWKFDNSARRSVTARQTPARAQQVPAGTYSSSGSFFMTATPFLSPERPFGNQKPYVWGFGVPTSSMHGPFPPAGYACIFQQPPPPPRKQSAVQPSSWPNRRAYAADPLGYAGKRVPFSCVQVKQQHKVLHAAAQKKKKTNARRRSAFRRRRAAQKKQHAIQRQQKQSPVPQSPVCPPAPHNTNSYLMDRFEQQFAAEQAAKAAAAQLAEAAAVELEEAAEWGHVMQQVSALQVSTAGSLFDDDLESPVCPPAPLLTNEYYMSRFEQQFAAEQAAQAAAAQLAEAAAAKLEDAAEWDPMVQQASALQVSTADSLFDDDDLESPVCPPAPVLTNEYYMSRFEEELKQQAAAAAAPAPVVDAGVAEWDPLLLEVHTQSVVSGELGVIPLVYAAWPFTR